MSDQLTASVDEESTQVKVWFQDGSLSERWEAHILPTYDGDHTITLWDPEGNELWKEEQFKERGIKRIEGLNKFRMEIKQ